MVKVSTIFNYQVSECSIFWKLYSDLLNNSSGATKFNSWATFTRWVENGQFQEKEEKPFRLFLLHKNKRMMFCILCANLMATFLLLSGAIIRWRRSADPSYARFSIGGITIFAIVNFVLLIFFAALIYFPQKVINYWDIDVCDLWNSLGKIILLSRLYSIVLIVFQDWSENDMCYGSSLLPAGTLDYGKIMSIDIFELSAMFVIAIMPFSWKLFSLISLVKGIQLLLLLTTCSNLLQITYLKWQTLLGIIITNVLYLFAMLMLISFSLERNMKSFFRNAQQQEQASKDKVHIMNMLCDDIKVSTFKTRQSAHSLKEMFHSSNLDLAKHHNEIEKSSFFIDTLIDYLVLLHQLDALPREISYRDKFNLFNCIQDCIINASLYLEVPDFLNSVNVGFVSSKWDFRTNEKHFSALIFYSLLSAYEYSTSLSIAAKIDDKPSDDNSKVYLDIVISFNSMRMLKNNQSVRKDGIESVAFIICYKLSKFLKGQWLLQSDKILIQVELQMCSLEEKKLSLNVVEPSIFLQEKSTTVDEKTIDNELSSFIVDNLIVYSEDGNINQIIQLIERLTGENCEIRDFSQTEVRTKPCFRVLSSLESINTAKVCVVNSLETAKMLTSHGYEFKVVLVSETKPDEIYVEFDLSGSSPSNPQTFQFFKQWLITTYILPNHNYLRERNDNFKTEKDADLFRELSVENLVTREENFSWYQTVIHPYQYESYAKWRYLNPGNSAYHHTLELQIFYFFMVIAMFVLYELQLLSWYSLIFFTIPPVIFFGLQRCYLFWCKLLPPKFVVPFSICWNIYALIILCWIVLRFSSLFADSELSSNLTDFANHIYHRINANDDSVGKNSTHALLNSTNNILLTSMNATSKDEFSTFLEARYGIYTGSDLLFSSANVITYALFLVDTIPWPLSIITAVALFLRPLIVVFGYLFTMVSLEDYQYQIGGTSVIGLLVIVAFHWYKEANYRREFLEIYQLLVSKFFIDHSFLHSRNNILSHLQHIQSMQNSMLCDIQKQLLLQKNNFFISLEVLEELNLLQLQILLYKQYITRFQMQEQDYFQKSKTFFIENMRASLLKVLVNQVFSTLLPPNCYSSKDVNANNREKGKFVGSNGNSLRASILNYFHEQENWHPSIANIRMYVHIHPSLTLVRIDEELFSAMMSQLCQLILQHIQQQTHSQRDKMQSKSLDHDKTKPALSKEEEQHHELLIWISPYSSAASTSLRFTDIRAMSVTILSTGSLPFVKLGESAAHGTVENTLNSKSASSVNDDPWKDFDVPLMDSDESGEWSHVDVKSFEDIEGVDIMCDKVISFLQIQEFHTFECGTVEHHLYKSYYKVCVPYMLCTDTSRLGELFQQLEGMIDIIERPNIKQYSKYYQLMQAQADLQASTGVNMSEVPDGVEISDAEVASTTSQQNIPQQKGKNKISILSLERGDLIREAYSLTQIWEKYQLEIQATYIIELPSPELFMTSDCVIIEYSRSSTYQTKELIHYLRGMQYYGNIVVAYNEDVQKQQDPKMKKLQNPNQYTDAVVADMHIYLPLIDSHVQSLAELCKSRIFSMVICNKPVNSLH